MNLIGKIKFIGEEVAVTEKFRKRDMVITDESNSQYPQHILMQCTQDKCGLLDSVNVGDVANVSFNIRGKSYNDKKTGEEKYFTTLEAWKIEVTAAAPPSTHPAPSYEQQVGPGTKYPNAGMPEGYVSPVPDAKPANTVVNTPVQNDLPF